jgi:glycosyltransferase involved in cell wall biosynthesis
VYLEKTLESILSQTYSNFELIILDNASTDDTPNICHAYAAKDKRIICYRNKENVGVAANFNRVFQLSSTEYFKWSACDDIIAPDFLSRCVEILDAVPSIVLCHSRTGRINEYGDLTGDYDLKIRIDSPKLHERFGDLICMSNEAWVLIFGLMRSNMLRKTQLMGSYIGSDRNLLAEISLIGRLHEIPEYLFFRRKHSQAYSETTGFKDYPKKLQWWTRTDRDMKTVFPYWKNCLEYFSSVGRMPLGWTERQQCYAQIVRWLFKEGWFYLCSDIVVNLIGSSNLRSNLEPLAKRFLELEKQAGPTC